MVISVSSFDLVYLNVSADEKLHTGFPCARLGLHLMYLQHVKLADFLQVVATVIVGKLVHIAVTVSCGQCKGSSNVIHHEGNIHLLSDKVQIELRSFTGVQSTAVESFIGKYNSSAIILGCHLGQSKHN